MLDGLSSQWVVNVWAIIFLGIMCVFFALAVWRARARGVHVPTIRLTSFVAGVILAAVLLFSPLEAIGRTQLFLIHMAQVVTLITICTPLIMAGLTEELMQPLLASPARGIILKLTSPLIASLIFNIVFLLWHTPKLFTVAQSSTSLYDLMMVSIFVTSFLNWHPLIGSIQESRHMSYPMQMLYAFFDGQPVDIFAFLLVFSSAPIYAFAVPTHLGLSAFGDQATAGAILLVPGIVDLGVMTPLFFRWLGQIEDRTRLGDQKRQEELEAEEWEDEYEDKYEDEQQVNEVS